MQSKDRSSFCSLQKELEYCRGVNEVLKIVARATDVAYFVKAHNATIFFLALSSCTANKSS